MPRKKPEAVFWASRPILSHLRHLANCKGQSPWPLLGWIIVRALHTVPWDVYYKSTVGEQALNSLVGISGPTGTGKTISYKLVEKHLIFPDNDPKNPSAQTWEGTVPPGSGESMPDSYVTFEPKKKEGEGKTKSPSKSGVARLSAALIWKHLNHAAVFFFDEVGMLTSRNSRQGSTLVEYLKEGWSGSPFGRALANGKGVVLPQDSYRFACVINTQPKRAGVLFSDEAVSGGLQGRFLWFDVTSDINRDLVTPEDVEPFQIPTINWSGVRNFPALKSMNQAHQQHHWNALDDLITESESHILLTQAKVAVAFAVLDGRVELTEEDWQLAHVVIKHTTKTRKAIEEALAEENRLSAVRDGKGASVKAVMTGEALHEQRVEQVAASIYRRRKKTGRKKIGRSDIASASREYIDEAEIFLDANPGWRPPT